MHIGLVGVGPWGAHILRDLKTLGAVVHAVANSDASIARATTGGAETIVRAPELLPQSCAGFVIANRTISHLDAIETLLPRGKSIFSEKPLGTDVQRMRALPRTAERLVFVMHKWRYHPGVLALAQMAREQMYGPLLGLRTFRTGWGNPHPDVNSLWILAPHELSIALEITGEIPQLVSAFADPLWPGADAAIAYLRTVTGVPVVLETSSAHSIPVRRVIARFQDAVCVLDSADYTALSVARFPDGERTVVRVSDELPLIAELRCFIAHVQGGKPPVTSLQDEIRIVETISAIEAHLGRQTTT